MMKLRNVNEIKLQIGKLYKIKELQSIIFNPGHDGERTAKKMWDCKLWRYVDYTISALDNKLIKILEPSDFILVLCPVKSETDIVGKTLGWDNYGWFQALYKGSIGWIQVKCRT